MRPPPAAFAPSNPTASAAAASAAAHDSGRRVTAGDGLRTRTRSGRQLPSADARGDLDCLPTGTNVEASNPASNSARNAKQQHSLETEIDYEIGDLTLREENGNNGEHHDHGGDGTPLGQDRMYLPLNSNASPQNETLSNRRGCLTSCVMTTCLCGCFRGWYSRSLASAPTTSWLATLGVPVAIVVAHALFYHGQTADMWRLQSTAHVDCWYNATSLEAKSVFRIAGLGDPYNIHVQVHDNNTIQTFTYYTAIQELWDAAGMDVDVFLPRLASVLLILFSGVWPHLKLLLLNFHWLLRPNSPTVFWWLSTLGKWSLSDVLVVCLMLGILHIDWNVEPDVVLQGIIHQAPTIMKVLPDLYTTSDICTYMLHRPCTERYGLLESQSSLSQEFLPDTAQSWGNDTLTIPHFLDWDLECSACLKFVDSSLAHPFTFQSTVQGIADGIATSGGGLVTLRVQGLMGIYSFCAAVVLSIALSCLVDIYAIRAAAATPRAPSAPATTATAPPMQQQQQRARVASCERPLLDGEEGQLAPDAPLDVADDPPLTPEDDIPPPEVHAHLTHRYAPLDSSEPASVHLDHRLIRTTSSLSLSSTSSPIQSDTHGQRVSCRSFWYTCATALSVVTAVIVGKTLSAPSLAREVVGVGPHWLEQVTGVRWDTTFSLTGLAAAVGEAGGNDRLLQATFAWFCVAGPALRATLCVVALCLPSRWCGTAMYTILLTAIEFVGAFCAVEVLAVAAYLVHMLIPSTTATIVNVPQCAQIAPENSTSACFEVFLEPQDSFQWLVVGTLLLLVVSQACHWLLPVKKRSRDSHR